MLWHLAFRVPCQPYVALVDYRSKSLGNFFTIRDVLREYHGMALRWFLIGTQYRQPISYSRPALDEASARLYYVYDTLRSVTVMIREAGADPCHQHAFPLQSE